MSFYFIRQSVGDLFSNSVGSLTLFFKIIEIQG